MGVKALGFRAITPVQGAGQISGSYIIRLITAATEIDSDEPSCGKCDNFAVAMELHRVKLPVIFSYYMDRVAKYLS